MNNYYQYGYRNSSLINDGILEIGTEEEPYLNTATIMLHGNVRCIELPIYGCKVLGVRKGFLELHGKPVNSADICHQIYATLFKSVSFQFTFWNHKKIPTTSKLI